MKKKSWLEMYIGHCMPPGSSRSSAQFGKTYKAQLLSREQVNEIVNSPWERGRVDENGVPVPGKNGQLQGNGRRA